MAWGPSISSSLILMPNVRSPRSKTLQSVLDHTGKASLLLPGLTGNGPTALEVGMNNVAAMAG